jgi:hypothetical protein
MSSAPASEFIVYAVPTVLQRPDEGADEATSSVNPLSRSHRVGIISRTRHRIVPDPVRSPLNRRQHRPAGQDDRRNVDRGRRHDLRRVVCRSRS